MNIAIIGCGYVADLYAQTFASYPELNLLGVCDRNAENLEAFCRRWPARKYVNLDELVGDSAIDLVLNLSNPRSHFEIVGRCLNAGKHVYTEKPLAMTLESALELVNLAERKNVRLAAAPCSLLSETAQTMWKAIREGVVGKIRLVYANFDDGMIAPTMSPWTWRNRCGTPWPAKDEFEVGCTYEHAGYVLTWLAAFFGPALRVTSFASCQIPDKGIAVDGMAPDFSVGCIEYSDGVVARVTCGLVAPKDKSLTVIGDDGVLFVGNVRDDYAPVYVRKQRSGRLRSILASRTRWLHRWLEARLTWPGENILFQRRYPHVRGPRPRMRNLSKPVDFMRGPAEVAEAVREGRPSRLSASLAAHIVELVEVLQYPGRYDCHKAITTSFPRIEPVSWAM